MKLNKHIQIAAFLIASPFILTSCGDKKESPDQEKGHDHSGHDHGSNSHKEGHADHMLEGYTVVATALFNDDLDSAKKAAAGIVKHDRNSSLAGPAKTLSTASDIATARSIFNDLSAAAIQLAKTEKGYKIAHCPMANGGKGGDWLQKSTDAKVNNPYYGAAMAHCGSFKK